MTNEANGTTAGPASAPDPTAPHEAVPHEAAQHDYEAPGERMPRRRIRALPGMVALAASALGLAALIVGVSVAASRTADAGDWVFASVVAIVANVFTGSGFVAGLVAVILRRGRPWGVAAMVLGVAANPFVLVSVFSFLG